MQMHDLIKEYSLDVVQAYMNHIMVAAEAAVRHMLHEFSLSRGMPEVSGFYCDKLSPICTANQSKTIVTSPHFPSSADWCGIRGRPNG
jgi:hypothetical protein